MKKIDINLVDLWPLRGAYYVRERIVKAYLYNTYGLTPGKDYKIPPNALKYPYATNGQGFSPVLPQYPKYYTIELRVTSSTAMLLKLSDVIVKESDYGWFE